MREIIVEDRVDILEKWEDSRKHAINKIERADNLRVFNIINDRRGILLYLENDNLPSGFICVRKYRVKLSTQRKIRRLK